MEKIILKSGVSIPAIGLGTFNIEKNELANVIHDACHTGYQLFDTATGYNNHIPLGNALNNQNKVNPLICTKINSGDSEKHHTIEKVIENILSELQIKHIDYLLIHNPKVGNSYQVLKELMFFKKTGLIKSIGVSNFTIKHLNAIEDIIQDIDINQIEHHPFLTQPELIEYCKKHDIKIMAYRPFGFGSSDFLNNSTLKELGWKHRKTTSQIILRWIIQNGHIAIPKASHPKHLKKNIDIFNFELNENEVKTISLLNQGIRTCTGPWAEFDA